MKLAIVGSRSFDDDVLFYEQLNAFCKKYNEQPTVIISGGVKGADTLAENYAKEHGYELIVFKPDYKRYGRGAAFIRNRLIVDHADRVLAFWNGKSTGTQYTIEYAKKHNKSVDIVDVSLVK